MRLFVSTIILVIIHIVGIIGIHSPLRDLFLMLTPFNLIMCIMLLFINHSNFNKSFFLFCFITFFISFFIEVAGVFTGIVFGNYSYGKTLGLKALDVPIIIGANWMMLIYCVGMICNKIKTSVFLKSLIGSSILVIFDCKRNAYSLSGDQIQRTAYFKCTYLYNPNRGCILWNAEYITGYCHL